MFYRHLSIHRRVTPVAVITDMKKCETPQILHHQIKCCGDLIVLKTNIVTAQVTVRPKMCIFTELERGMVVSSFLVETFTCWFFMIILYKTKGVSHVSSLQTLLYGYVIRIFYFYLCDSQTSDVEITDADLRIQNWTPVADRECIYECSLPVLY